MKRETIREVLALKWHSDNNGEFSASWAAIQFIEKRLNLQREKYHTIKLVAEGGRYDEPLQFVGYRLENDEEYGKRVKEAELIAEAFRKHDEEKKKNEIC